MDNMNSHSDDLWSATQKHVHPVEECDVLSRVNELGYQFAEEDSVEGGADVELL